MKMLVDGPTEWGEAATRAGSKLDLLSHAYNAKLGVAAFPKGASVVLTKFESDTGPSAASDDVYEKSVDELVLHPEAEQSGMKPDVFRYVAWSRGATQHQYLAVAAADRVEVWRVDAKESLQAVKVGSYGSNLIRGICWNPLQDLLLAYTSNDMAFMKVEEGDHLRVLDAGWSPQLVGSRHAARSVVWSPCGLVLARVTESVVDFLSWSSPSDVVLHAPAFSSFRVDRSESKTLLGDGVSRLGSATSFVLLSSSVGIVVTDTPLVIEDVKQVEEPARNDNVVTLAVSTCAASTSKTSNMIDLTALRVTATSKSSLLRVLDPPKPMAAQGMSPTPRSSHMTIISRSMQGSWEERAQVSLPQLSIPDVLDVESMRVVIGSSISSSLIALHLDHSLKSGWSASISGTLNLPEGHVCRGVRVTKTSPFVQVASAEKPKRTFFHAASGSQRIHLSKFKLPRRRRESDSPSSSPVAAPNTSPEPAPPSTHSVSDSLASALLQCMEELQSLVVTRFDRMERRLDDVNSRLHRLEVQCHPT